MKIGLAERLGISPFGAIMWPFDRSTLDRALSTKRASSARSLSLRGGSVIFFFEGMRVTRGERPYN